MYRWRLAGVCFRCWGAGIELTPAERARRKAARALPEAREAVEIDKRDIADWTEELAHRKARAIQRADREVERGRAANRAAAFEAMKAQHNNHNVRQVQTARQALAICKARLVENQAKLRRLEARGVRN
jgi:hypothetical protein